MPGSGRWSLAYALERRLFDQGRTAHVLEPVGESLSTMIAAARACTEAGLVAICAFEGKTLAERAAARERIGKERFFEVFVDTKPEVCLERRPKADLSGFEPPKDAALRVSLDRMLVEPAVDQVLHMLTAARQFEA